MDVKSTTSHAGGPGIGSGMRKCNMKRNERLTNISLAFNTFNIIVYTKFPPTLRIKILLKAKQSAWIKKSIQRYGNNFFLLWMIDYGNSFFSSLLLLFTGLIIKFINGKSFSEFIEKFRSEIPIVYMRYEKEIVWRQNEI